MTEILGKRSKGPPLKDKVKKEVKQHSAFESPATSTPSLINSDPTLLNNTIRTMKKKAKTIATESQLPIEEVSNTIEQEEESKTSKSTSLLKKVHLSSDQAEAKIKELQQRLEELTGPENANKRKRALQRLIQLKKALYNPDDLLVDPIKEQQRIAEDRERRIQKKLEKAKKLKKANSKSQRNKNAYCIICKQKGHLAEDCRQGQSDPSLVKELGRHICFNCGSKDHALKDCPKPRGEVLLFATCFFCKEKGHLSRDCPQNEEGIYHKGGSCYECGSKRHLAKECPHRQGRKEVFNGDNNQTNEDHMNNEGEINEDNQGYDEDNNDQQDENDIFSEDDA